MKRTATLSVAIAAPDAAPDGARIIIK